MDVRAALLFVHLVSAVLGVGPIMGLVVVARGGGSSPAVAISISNALLRLTNWGLLAMVLSGLALLYQAQWIQVNAWWLRIGVLLACVVGMGLGLAQSALRQAKRDPSRVDSILSRVATLSWISVAAVVATVALMALKPF